MGQQSKHHDPSPITYNEKEYQNIQLNRNNIIKLLKIAHKTALKSCIAGTLSVTIGAILTDKRFRFSKILKNPRLLLIVIYSMRFTSLFSYSHSFFFSILTEILPIYTKWSFLTCDTLAGLISGFTMMFDTPKQQEFVSVWSLSKAVEALCIALHRKNILRVPFGSQIIFSSFVAQLIYSLIYHPLSLAPTDLKNLKEKIPVGSVKQLFSNREQGDFDPTLFEIVANNRVTEKFDDLCSFAHSKQESCMQNSFYNALHFTKKHAGYFLLLSILPTLILNPKQFFKRPLKILGSKLFGVSQTCSLILSTAMLLNYQVCKSPWTYSTQSNPHPMRYLTLIQGFLAGFLTSSLQNAQKISFFNLMIGTAAASSLVDILMRKKLLFVVPLFHPTCYSVCFTALLVLLRHDPGILSPAIQTTLQLFFLKNRVLHPESSELEKKDQNIKRSKSTKSK